MSEDPPADEALLAAARAESEGAGPLTLRTSYAALSAAYRQAGGGQIAEEEINAYLAARLPATLRATRRVLEEIHALLPDFTPSTLLDLGCGPGTASAAGMATFPSLRSSQLLEQSGPMLAIGKALFAEARLDERLETSWSLADATRPDGLADLVVAAYLLGEIDEHVRRDAVARWWQTTRGCLVFIEPGTPKGYRAILEARHSLIADGARVLAPCPGNGECPLDGDDWCHFSERVGRTGAHRQAKEAVRGFEDEKFSYLVLTRLAGQPAPRVLTRPLTRSGYVALRVCTTDGAEQWVFSRRQGEAYRAARTLRWGDAIPSAVAEASGRPGTGE